jgi:threonine/homoserine/homoserine lactone efflux protein
MIEHLIKGILIGFCIAAPVGPIGLLCIQKTLHFGRLAGLAAGLGAACADAFYGACAAFCLHWVSSIFDSKQGGSLHFVGGAVLIFLGTRILFTKTQKTISVTHKTLLRDFFSTFFLTLANPLTIVAFLAVFAGLGVEPSPWQSGVLTAGVFCGAASWWLLLCEGVTLFRARISQNLLRLLNQIAGIALVLLGIAALVFPF